MTVTVDILSEAAAALAARLPSPTALTATRHPAPAILAGQGVQAVMVSYVGAPSADLAVYLADGDLITAATGGESAVVSPLDVLRPALEGATDVLGAGVLGEARLDDASALLSDPDTAVFELAGKEPAGWFAIRLRDNGVSSSEASEHHRFVTEKLSRISNVEMTLTVEIGRTRMAVRDVLSLEPGDVIELDRSAGTPADVLLNGRLIAHGEVVVVDQDYAVRITKILDAADSVS